MEYIYKKILLVNEYVGVENDNMWDKQKIKLERQNDLFQIYRQPEFDTNKVYDISVVVCTYNPFRKSLFFTLDSIINQKNVDIEIIIADDGSKKDIHNEIIQYFNTKNFKDWIIVCNKVNRGTVYNLYTGLKVCNGNYVKIISPGDALYGECILKEWLEFHKNNNYKWSFSDAIYYVNEPEGRLDIEVPAHPNNISPYMKKNKNVCRWNYIVLDDIALGATLFCEKQIIIEYIAKVVGKVIYAEDNIWRMMMFDGIVGGYFPRNTIFYEYGTGISTKAKAVWAKRLENDWNNANKLMINKKQLDEFQKAVIGAWKINNSKNKILKLFIKGKLKFFIIRKFRCRKTVKRAKEYRNQKN